MHLKSKYVTLFNRLTIWYLVLFVHMLSLYSLILWGQTFLVYVNLTKCSRQTLNIFGFEGGSIWQCVCCRSAYRSMGGGVLTPMVSKPLAQAFFAAAAAHNWRKVGARILIRSSRARIGERSEPKPEPERKKAPA